MNTNATTPATESQHPRTNEGACESEVTKLNAAQVAFLSKATSDCADLTASRVFGDVDPDTYAMLSADDKKALMLTYEKWNQNGNIEPRDLDGINSGYFIGQAWVWASYVAHLLPQLVARYALDMETFATGSRMNAAQLNSTRARLTDVCDAVKAERECEKALGSGSFGEEWRAFWDAQALTDMLVSKHAGAGVVDEPITAEALGREGWSRACPSPDCCWTKEIGDYGDNDLELQVQINPGDTRVFVEIGMRTREVQNVRTMNDVRQLVRLFTAPDAARAPDEEATTQGDK